MRTARATVLGALVIFALGCVTSPPDRAATVVQTATPTAVEEFLAQTWPYMDKFGPIDSAVIDAMILVAQEATRPWSEDPTVSQADAVRPPSGRPVIIGSREAVDEIIDVLRSGKRVEPFIPSSYRDALESAADQLERAIAEVDALIAYWQSLNPPPTAAAWHNAQLGHFIAVAASYEQMLTNRRSVLDSGGVTVDAKQDAILRRLTEQEAKDAAERAYKRMESLFRPTQVE